MQDFSSKLIFWNDQYNRRLMPWKNEKDPYRVWISEIILQQTRVEQGWNYYLRFISEFPSIEKLANAKEEDVYKLWEGLGYYSRCRNLIFSARYIMQNLNGKFPTDYEGILKLKGIGPYTAAAIGSFCYNLPYPVVDGNVSRVLARYFKIEEPVDTAKGKNLIYKLALQLIRDADPATFNQAIMDFGATICKPAQPLCNICTFNKTCLAFIARKADHLPVKLKQPHKKERWIHYFVFKHADKILIRKRSAKDIWQNLFEFYFYETPAKQDWNKKAIKNLLKSLKIEANKYSIQKGTPQQLTHRIINGSFITIEIISYDDNSFPDEYFWHPQQKLADLPFPKYIHQNYFSLPVTA